MLRMPGKSYQGPLVPLTEKEQGVQHTLQVHVNELAERIGERNLTCYPKLLEAASYIRGAWQGMGYEVSSQEYRVGEYRCENLEVEVPGTRKSKEIILIGAHYDSVKGSPGANDNGTGVAALLELARSMSGSPLDRTVRFVAFVNEEPPYFQTSVMGSRVYAERSRQLGERVKLMFSLETMGYYSEAEGSQRYPFPLSFWYPSVGNFIGFVGNLECRSWVQRVVGSFRARANVPSEGAALWGGLPGVGWSDHWSFWQEGFPAVMVTDTALFRDPHYHTAFDLSEYIHFEFLTHVVMGLSGVLSDIGNGP